MVPAPADTSARTTSGHTAAIPAHSNSAHLHLVPDAADKRNALRTTDGVKPASLTAFVVTAALVLYAGWYATTAWGAFYAVLDKPAWALPAAIFTPIWVLMFLVLPAGAWRAVHAAHWLNSCGVIELFAAQLFVNMLWQIMLFGRHFGAAAMLMAVTQVVLVGLFVVNANRLRRFTGYLVVPYAVWMLYLFALTAALWQRNPALL